MITRVVRPILLVLLAAYLFTTSWQVSMGLVTQAQSSAGDIVSRIEEQIDRIDDEHIDDLEAVDEQIDELIAFLDGLGGTSGIVNTSTNALTVFETLCNRDTEENQEDTWIFLVFDEDLVQPVLDALNQLEEELMAETLDGLDSFEDEVEEIREEYEDWIDEAQDLNNQFAPGFPPVDNVEELRDEVCRDNSSIFEDFKETHEDVVEFIDSDAESERRSEIIQPRINEIVELLNVLITEIETTKTSVEGIKMDLPSSDAMESTADLSTLSCSNVVASSFFQQGRVSSFDAAILCLDEALDELNNAVDDLGAIDSGAKPPDVISDLEDINQFISSPIEEADEALVNAQDVLQNILDVSDSGISLQRISGRLAFAWGPASSWDDCPSIDPCATSGLNTGLANGEFLEYFNPLAVKDSSSGLPLGLPAAMVVAVEYPEQVDLNAAPIQLEITLERAGLPDNIGVDSDQSPDDNLPSSLSTTVTGVHLGGSSQTVEFGLPSVPVSFTGTISARLISTVTGEELDEADWQVGSGECGSPWAAAEAELTIDRPGPRIQRPFDFFSLPSEAAGSDYVLTEPGSAIVTAEPRFVLESGATSGSLRELYCLRTYSIDWFIKRYLPFDDSPELFITDENGNTVTQVIVPPPEEGDGDSGDSQSASPISFTGERVSQFPFHDPGIYLFETVTSFAGEEVQAFGENIVIPRAELRLLDVTTGPSTSTDESPTFWDEQSLAPFGFTIDLQVGSQTFIEVRPAVASFDFYQINTGGCVETELRADVFASAGGNRIGGQFNIPVSNCVPLTQWFDADGNLLEDIRQQLAQNATFVRLFLDFPLGTNNISVTLQQLNPSNQEIGELQTRTMTCQPFWELSKLSRDEALEEFLATANFSNALETKARLEELVGTLGASFLTLSPLAKQEGDRLIVKAFEPITLSARIEYRAVRRDDADVRKACPAAVQNAFDFGEGTTVTDQDEFTVAPFVSTSGRRIVVSFSHEREYGDGQFAPTLRTWLTDQPQDVIETSVPAGTFASTDRPIVLSITPQRTGVFLNNIAPQGVPFPGLLIPPVANEITVTVDWNGNLGRPVLIQGWNGVVIGRGENSVRNAFINGPGIEEHTFDVDMTSLTSTTRSVRNFLKAEAEVLSGEVDADGNSIIRKDIDTHLGNSVQREFFSDYYLNWNLDPTANLAFTEQEEDPGEGRSGVFGPPKILEPTPASAATASSGTLNSEQQAESPLSMQEVPIEFMVAERMLQEFRTQLEREVQAEFADSPDDIYDPVAFRQGMNNAMSRVSIDEHLELGTFPVSNENGDPQQIADQINQSESPIEAHSLLAKLQGSSTPLPRFNAQFDIRHGGSANSHNVRYNAVIGLGGMKEFSDQNTPQTTQGSRASNLPPGDGKKREGRLNASIQSNFRWDSALQAGFASAKINFDFEISMADLKQDKASAAVSVSTSIELGFNLKGNVDFEGTFFQFTVSVSPSATIPFTIAGVIPIGIDLVGQLTYKINIAWHGYFVDVKQAKGTLFVAAEIYAYLGGTKAGVTAKAGIFGGGDLTFDFIFFQQSKPPEVQFNCAQGYVGGRAEIDIKIFQGKWELRWVWKAGRCTIPFPVNPLDTRRQAARQEVEPSGSNIRIEEETDGFDIDTSRDFAGPDYAQFVNESLPFNIFGASETRLIENAYPYSSPQLITNGEAFVLVWIQDDVTKSEFQGRELWYSIAGSDFDFSEPQRYTMDDAQDSEPSLAFDSDGNLVMAWSRNRDPAMLADLNVSSLQTNMDILSGSARSANRSLQTDVPSFEEIFSQSEIAYAVLDLESQTWSEPEFLTSNEVLDGTPQLVADENGQMMIVWAQNDSNLPYPIVDEIPAETLLTANWDANLQRFSAPETLRENDSALSRTFAYGNGQLLYASIEDGNVYASFFNEGGFSRMLLEEGGENSAVQAAFALDGTPIAIWVHNEATETGSLNGMLREAKYIDGQWMTRTVELESTKAINGASLVQTLDGNLALLFSAISESQGRGTDLYSMIYDSHIGGWSQPRQLTNDADYEYDVSPVVIGDSVYVSLIKESVIFENQTINYTGPDSQNPDEMIEGEEFVIQDVMVPTGRHLHVLRAGLDAELNIAGDLVRLTPALPAAGDTVTIEVPVRNVGRMGVAAEQTEVELRESEAGSAIDSVTLGPLPIDGVQTASFEIELHDDAGPTAFYAVVNPDGAVTESFVDNNSAVIPVLTHDWSIESLNIGFRQIERTEEEIADALEAAVINNPIPEDASDEEREAIAKAREQEFMERLYGEEAVLTMKVTNESGIDAPVGEALIEFAEVDEFGEVLERTSLETIVIPAIAAGESVEVEYTWEFTDFAAPTYTFFITVGSGQTLEVNRDNNLFQLSVERLPELTVFARLGEENQLRIRVVNNGVEVASNVPVGIYQLDESGQVMGEPFLVEMFEEVAPLGGRAEREVTLPDNLAGELALVVNYDMLIAELELSNNSTRVTVP